MSVKYDLLVGTEYKSDSSKKIWTEYYMPFYSKMDWDFWKVFDYEHLRKEKGRYYARYNKKNIGSGYDYFKGCELGGEMDFNFNSDPNPRLWQRRKYEYYKDLLETDTEMTSADKEEAVDTLDKCKKRQNNPCNLSVIISMGGLNNVKGKVSQDKRALDRFDIFIYILKDYFDKRNKVDPKEYEEDYMHIIFSEAWHYAKGNRECLYEYLRLYKDIEDYFKKNYNIDIKEDKFKNLIKNIVESGKKPIDSGKRVMEYLKLAEQYWDAKEAGIKKIIT